MTEIPGTEPFYLIIKMVTFVSGILRNYLKLDSLQFMPMISLTVGSAIIMFFIECAA